MYLQSRKEDHEDCKNMKRSLKQLSTQQLRLRDWLRPQKHTASIVLGPPSLQFHLQSTSQTDQPCRPLVISIDSSCSSLSQMEVEMSKPILNEQLQPSNQEKSLKDGLNTLTEQQFSKLQITEKDTEQVITQSQQSSQSSSAKEQYQVSDINDIDTSIRKTERQLIRRRIEEQSQILDRLKNHHLAGPFLTAVDEENDQAPNYYLIIDDPIDLQTISHKNEMGMYHSFLEFHEDIQKIWTNSYIYNKRNPYMRKATNDLKRFYLKLVNRQIALLQT